MSVFLDIVLWDGHESSRPDRTPVGTSASTEVHPGALLASSASNDLRGAESEAFKAAVQHFTDRASRKYALHLMILKWAMKPFLMDLICPAVLPSIPIGESDTPVEWSEMSRDSPATGVVGEDVKNCIQQAKAIDCPTPR